MVLHPERLASLVTLLLLVFAFLSCTGGEAGPVQSRFDQLIAKPPPETRASHLVLPPPDRPQFEHLTVDDGLSQNTVFCILQDSHGFMWFGTEHGLNRFDGFEFTVYVKDESDESSLGDSWITSLAEDSTGTIWVGTLTGGVGIFDRKTNSFTRLRHDEGDTRSIGGNEVTAIVHGRLGSWVGTTAGLSKYDPSDRGFSRFSLTGSGEQADGNHVLSLFEDSLGSLWIGTAGDGLYRLPADAHTFGHFSVGGGSHDENTVRAVAESPDGGLFLGTDAGLLLLDPVTGDSRPIREIGLARVDALFLDPADSLWVGTIGTGLLVLGADGVLYRHLHDSGDDRSISSNSVVEITRDREGTFWIGSLPGGINKLTVDNRVFLLHAPDPDDLNSLSDNWVRSVLEADDGVLWIGTGGGLNRFDSATGQWTRYSHDPDDPGSINSNYISMLSQHDSGVMLIPSERSLDILDPASGRFIHHHNDPDDPTSLPHCEIVWLATQVNNGATWIGTLGGGLSRFNIESGTFTHFTHDPDNPESLLHNNVWNIQDAGDGKLWIGTQLGLDLFDPDTGRFVHFLPDLTDPNSLSDGFVGAIFPTESGTVWVGTVGGGLNLLDPVTGDVDRIGSDHGLPSDVVMGIAPDDDGNLWVSTIDGLARIRTETLEVSAYDRSDGVPLTEFNAGAAILSATGRLYLGGIGGLVEFDPRHIRENGYLPPIVVTSVSAEGERIDLDNTNSGDVIIRWPKDSFDFEFVALSYTNPHLNEYAYKLEGLEEEWTESGTVRAGHYRRLPGGDYTLRVIGSNDDGYWNTSGASVSIRVIPPFWATWWFRGAGVLLVLGAAVAVYVLRMRAVAARTEQLERQVAERTDALQQEIGQRLAAEEALRGVELERVVSEERGRLARDLHDSVTQSLYSLTLFIEASRELAEKGRLDQAKHGLDRSSRTALQALKELRLLVYELRPLALREMGLCGAIQDRLDAVENRAGVHTDFAVKMDPACDLPSDVEEALFRIAQEALNNALKHADATSIMVRLESESSGHLELEISDNGAGFDREAASVGGGIGLRGMKERAERLRGGFTVNSSPGRGTRIIVVLEEA